MKKALLSVLALLLCICCTGCIRINNSSQQTAPPETESGTALPSPFSYATSQKRAQAQAYLDALPVHTFSNSTFEIAEVSYDAYSVIPDSTHDSYNVALAERNTMAGAKFGVTVTGFCEDSTAQMAENANKAILAGLRYSDLIVCPAAEIPYLASRGLLLNFNSLSLDYSQPYMENTSQTSAGYMNYGCYGALTRNIGSYYCLYINRALLNSLGIEIPYASVRDGSWTWDKLLEIKRSAADINGSITAFGAVSASELCDVLYASSGSNYLYCTPGAMPELNINTDMSRTVLSTLSSLTGNSFVCDGARESFMGGNVLFFISTVNDMRTITEMGGDWCILPIPKVSAEQTSYVSAASASQPIICATYDQRNSRDTAAMIQALNAASYSWLDDSYYDLLALTSIRDSDTLDMLDYVCGVKNGQILYDLANTFSLQYPGIDEYTSAVFSDSMWGISDFDSAASSAKSNLASYLPSLFYLPG